VTFGLNQDNGLTIGNSTLNSGGLTVNNANNNEQIQVGADGVKFATVNNNGVAGAGIENTARITRDGIGFNDGSGGIKNDLPHLSKDGINAGNKELTNVKSAINPATNGGQPDFVTRLGRAGTDASKQKSAATVKDLYDLSQSPLTFAGDTGNSVAKKLGETLTIKGGETAEGKLTDGNNIGVVANGNDLTVKLAKTLTGLEAVNTQNLTATGKVTVGSGNNTAELQNSGLTFSQTGTAPATNSKTVYGVDGLKFTDNDDTPLEGTTRITKDKVGFADSAGSLDESKPYLDNEKLKVGTVEISKDTGINAGGKKISNIAQGTENTDAVNYEQHKQVADKVADLNKADLDQVKTALQTFTVKKDNATDDETITVGKDNTSGKVNTLTLKGENGLTVATSKADGT
ncbi:adhesin, partial [Moraxella catarrhalis]